jgi:hypothetical protein
MLLLVTWIFVFGLIAIPVAAAHGWLVRRGWDDERVLLTAPLIFAGVMGYLVFWAYFLHPVFGRVVSFLLMLGLLALWVRSKPRFAPGLPSRGLALPALLGFAIGLFYLALLYLPELGHDPEWQSSFRFLYPFPIDANLPKMLGDRLYAGEPLKPFLPEAGWLSSDRPPLQVGLYLFVRPWLGLVHLPVGLGYQCLGTLAQLFWLPGAWLLCQALRLDRRRSAVVILVIAASGFLLFNSTFVWPKLLAGGFVLMAAVLLLDRSAPRSAPVTGLAAAAIALGWLAHGAAAFSVVTLALLLLLPRYFPGWKNCLVAAVVFGLLALPWTAYQKFYDPPANRLLKWHLAGVVPIDARGTLETIRDSYAALPRENLLANRQINLGMLFRGSHASAVDLFTTPIRQRRVDEFFYLFRSLGILNLAWVVAPAVWLLRRRLPPHFELQGLLLGWTVLTLVFWVLVMFTPASTVVHSSSYAMMLSFFLLAVIFILYLPAWIAWALLGWHLLDFALTWVPYYGSAPVQPCMIWLMALSAVLIGFALRRTAPAPAGAVEKSAGKPAAPPFA